MNLLLRRNSRRVVREEGGIFFFRDAVDLDSAVAAVEFAEEFHRDSVRISFTDGDLVIGHGHDLAGVILHVGGGLRVEVVFRCESGEEFHVRASFSAQGQAYSFHFIFFSVRQALRPSNYPHNNLSG